MTAVVVRYGVLHEGFVGYVVLRKKDGLDTRDAPYFNTAWRGWGFLEKGETEKEELIVGQNV